MATETASLDLGKAGLALPSLVFFVLGALIALFLLSAYTFRLATEKAAFSAQTKGPASLTWVAGAALLAGRATLLGGRAVGLALLGTSLCGWPYLLFGLSKGDVATPDGVVFLPTVSAQALASTAALLAAALAGWPLLYLAALLCLGGLLAYPWGLRRFSAAALRRGRGSHWVAGGAVAVSAVGCAQLGRAAGAVGPAALATVGRDLGVALWVGALAWLVPLLYSELRVPRRWLAEERWATAFPLAVYGLASRGAAPPLIGRGAAPLGDCFLALALLLWLALSVWSLRCALALARGGRAGRARV